MRTMILNFVRDERGVTAIELGILLVFGTLALMGFALFAAILYRLIFGF